MTKLSKRRLLFEASINTFSGMVLAVITQQTFNWISPHVSWLNVQIDIQSNIILTIFLTGVAVLRGYLWRRFFYKRQR